LKRLLVVVAVVLTAAGPVSGGGVGAQNPRPVAAFKHPLYAVAQDGARIAWAVGPCGSVTIREGAAARMYGFHGDLCSGGTVGFGRLALGGPRAVWWTWWAGNDTHQVLETGVLGGRKRQGDETQFDCTGYRYTGLAADGATVLYAEVETESPSDEDPCGVPVTKTGGVHWAATGNKIGDVPAAVAIAVSGPLLAVIPLDPNRLDYRVRGAVDGPVNVYDLRRSTLRTSVAPTGRAVALAVSDRILAVLVKSEKTTRIERFDIQSQTRLGSTTVPNTTVAALSLAGTRVVYRTGRMIWVLDGISGRRVTVAAASASPIGLSIEGNRLLWGENVRGRGRIMSLQLAP
jgi:hypothetical protein